MLNAPFTQFLDQLLCTMACPQFDILPILEFPPLGDRGEDLERNVSDKEGYENHAADGAQSRRSVEKTMMTCPCTAPLGFYSYGGKLSIRALRTPNNRRKLDGRRRSARGVDLRDDRNQTSVEEMERRTREMASVEVRSD